MIQRPLTGLETLLIDTLCRFVRQHLPEENGVYYAAFIGINKDVLMLLVECGVMVEDYPEKNYGEFWGRVYYAHFPKEPE